jgi:PAS domain S-box-containing protein
MEHVSGERRELDEVVGLRQEIFVGLEHIVRELGSSEARFRDLVLDAADGILVVDDTGLIVYANPAACEIFGRTLDDLVGERFAPAKAGVGPVELEIRHPDGATAAVELRAATGHWGDERTTVVSLRDVSLRSRREQAVRARERSLERAAHGAGDGLWEWDLATGMLTLCDEWFRVTGLVRGDVVPTAAMWLGRVHPDDRQRFESEIGDHVEGRSPRLRSEFRMRTGDGRWHPMLLRATVSRDATGSAVRLSGSLTPLED